LRISGPSPDRCPAPDRPASCRKPGRPPRQVPRRRCRRAAGMLAATVFPGRLHAALYRGVDTTSGAPPGTINVLVPLPLFISRPGAPEPGTVVVAIEPTWPVTTPVPRGVVKNCPVLGTCDPTKLPGAAGADEKGALCAATGMIATGNIIRNRNDMFVLSYDLFWDGRSVRSNELGNGDPKLIPPETWRAMRMVHAAGGPAVPGVPYKCRSPGW
jgi:hypothetical protein